MGDISLYLTDVSASVGRSMDVEQSQRPHRGKESESVELGELGKREEQQQRQQREKAPRRVIHFSSGETMEEYSTDEEEEDEEEDKEAESRDLLTPPDELSTLTWGPYVWFHMWRAATSTISACDYLGERMASFFGITSAKYQYAIDEYYRRKKEREEEKEESRLSEEAERSFDQSQSPADDDDDVVAMTAPAEEASTRPDVTYQMEDENQTPSSVIVVPAIITAT